MKTCCRASSLMMSLLLIGLVGCQSDGHFSLFGYSTAPLFDTTIRNVYVPIPLNESYTKDLEFQLHQAVVRELNQRGLRVTSQRSNADTELELKIVAPRKSTVLMNQNGEARQVEMALNIEVVWRDLRQGHAGDVLSNPTRFDPAKQPLPGEARPGPPAAIPLTITPVGVYAPEVGGSTQSGLAQSIQRAAEQVVNMMEKWR